MILTCTFTPGKIPNYRYKIKSDLSEKKLDIELDRKTFCNELKIHGKPDKKWSIIQGDVVCFFYQYNTPENFKYFPNGDYE